jgi:hypothetical protein
MKTKIALASLVCALLLAIPQPSAQAPRPERISIFYGTPANKAHLPILEMLKEHQALEKIREILSPIRWPRTLKLEVASCGGEANAWYEDAVVTVCYEYLQEMLNAANSRKRPEHVSRDDALVGPFVDTFLHEAGHAAFDLLKIPLLGREEDAADQFAAYLVLQFKRDKKKKLILGAAFGYASALNVRSARDLKRPRLAFGRHITHSDEHGTPAQRLYNLLCIAYGSDKELFGDVVKLGYLPPERAERCEDEYRQVDHAYRTLIAPHVDGADPKQATRGKSDVLPIKAPAPHRR